ncbi:hypothetical protein L195_g006148 [Trifolium pratense]|uniref:Uncharacterized protein n=1 Tax=Trifolium pratense TaxID=57577 RepID=A0A2K3P2S6_TRIPR|nr:hypothetical protein L195_g006148 [Trifolium pratense]
MNMDYERVREEQPRNIPTFTIVHPPPIDLDNFFPESLEQQQLLDIERFVSDELYRSLKMFLIGCFN